MKTDMESPSVAVLHWICEFFSFVKRTATVYVLLALGVGWVLGQDRAPEPQPVFHVESQLVLLDMVVTDDKGNVVTDLGRDDFTVYEDGVLQNIRNFDPPEKEREKLLSLPAVAPKDRNGNDDWGNAPLTILVIDALNTPFEETAYSRQQVNRYLKAQPPLLKAPTIVFWLSDSGFHPIINGFTRDRDALMNAVDTHKATLPNKAYRGALVEQLGQSLSALQQMALFSRGNKGSKQIIWVGRSFPGVDTTPLTAKQKDLFTRAVSSTVDLLMQCRATVYVVDPTVSSDDLVNTVPDLINPMAIVPYIPDDPFEKNFSFRSLIDQTGGQYFYGRNDLNNEIENGIERGTNFYSLSYVPSEPIEDGKYRKIDIRLSNPKLHIQARKGYYPAPPEGATPDEKELNFDLQEAIIAGMTYTGVGLRVDGCQLEANHISATCGVFVDNNSLSFASGPGDGTERSTVVAVIAALDAKSALLASKVMQVQLGIPFNVANRKDLGFTKLQLRIVVPPSAKAMRVAVRDNSGRIGVVSVDSTLVSKLMTAGISQHARK